MFFQVGDVVVLQWDDAIENQTIIGKPLSVIKPPISTTAPFWMTVEYERKFYSVRGSDCRKLSPSKTKIAARYLAAMREMDPIMDSMLRKLRKKSYAWLTLKKLTNILKFLGGWKIEPMVGLVRLHPELPNSMLGELYSTTNPQTTKHIYQNIKSLEVSNLPSQAVAGKHYCMNVSPIQIQQSVWDENEKMYMFHFLHWVGAEGLRFSDLNGQYYEFLPTRMDIPGIPGDHLFLGTLPPVSKLRVYNLTDWIMNDSSFLAQVNEALGTEEHQPGRVRTQANTGSCSVCFRNIKLIPGNPLPLITLHGYQRPGDGVIVGNCEGMKWPPLELSPAGAVHYRDHTLIPTLKGQVEILDQCKTEKIPAIKTPGKRYKDPSRMLAPGDADWPDALANLIQQTENQIKITQDNIKMYTAFIDHWKLKPLPKEGDFAPIWEIPK